jgi:hypothetical protein
VCNPVWPTPAALLAPLIAGAEGGDDPAALLVNDAALTDVQGVRVEMEERMLAVTVTALAATPTSTGSRAATSPTATAAVVVATTAATTAATTTTAIATEVGVASDDDSVGRAIVRLVDWRLLPALSLLQLFNQLDRSSLANAKAPLMSSLRINDSQFGLAASIFQVGDIHVTLPTASRVARLAAAC